jgi:hypothetical protein
MLGVAPYSRAQRTNGRQVPRGAAGWYNLDQLFSDSLLPSQIGAENRANEGERRLLAAILLSAVDRAPKARGLEGVELDDWIAGARAPVTLAKCCDVLGLDLERVRHGLKARRRRSETRRAA